MQWLDFQRNTKSHGDSWYMRFAPELNGNSYNTLLLAMPLFVSMIEIFLSC